MSFAHLQADVASIPLADESCHALLSDPPYGLSFMGRKWDKDVPAADLWREVYRVLKPGAFGLVFGGTRTFHRLAVALEDAGFELRDTLCWLYSSGFPKSLDVSKAIDKNNGEAGRRWRFTAWMRKTGLTAKRINELTGTFMGSHYLTDKEQAAIPTAEMWAVLRPHCGPVPKWVDELVDRIEAERDVVGDYTVSRDFKGRDYVGSPSNSCKVNITAPATPEAARWDGYGTALKPAHEIILLVQKPLTLQAICAILVQTLGGVLCQLSSSVRDADESLRSSLAEPVGEASASALWNAAAACNTPEGLSALMDMWRSGSAMPSSLNIVLSWLDTLVTLSDQVNRFTTEMKTGLITDLKTFNSLVLGITPECIIRAVTSQPGTASSAWLAESILCGVRAKLECTRIPSVPANATLPGVSEDLHPEWRPVFLVRKPSAGTIAGNALEHGCGALNIDGGRVGASDGYEDNTVTQGVNTAQTSYAPAGTRRTFAPSPSGRWPANVILDEAAGEMLDEHAGERPGNGGVRAGTAMCGGKIGPIGLNGKPRTTEYLGRGSTTASRFYYCAKAHSAERNAGLEDVYWQREPLMMIDRTEWEALEPGNRARGCIHPTVKPIDLCRYLATLLLPPGNATLLVPFAGSGSEMIGAHLAGWGRIIGLERNTEYIEIQRRRCEWWGRSGPAEASAALEALTEEQTERDAGQEMLL